MKRNVAVLESIRELNDMFYEATSAKTNMKRRRNSFRCLVKN